MVQYLILVIQNSLETMLLVALMMALGRILDRKGQGKWLLRGFMAGVAGSVVLAVLKSTTVWINREYYNVSVLSLTLLAESVWSLYAWQVEKIQSSSLKERFFNLAGFAVMTLLLLYGLPDLFLYPTRFLVGDETMYSTEFLFKVAGYVSGLGLSFILGLSLFNAAIHLPVKIMRLVSTGAFAVAMINQLAAVIQVLLARRIIPVYRWLFKLIIPIINYNEFFLYAVMLITLVLPVMLWIIAKKARPVYSNPAEHRRIRAGIRGRMRWSMSLLTGYVVVVLILTVVKGYAAKEVALSPAEPMTIADNRILIPIETINDGHLHRFAMTASDGTEVRFIVIQKSVVAYGVGLDACDICGATGYYERKGQVICMLCDVVMNVSTIGFKGGCNPVPLAYGLDNGKMVIRIEDLENEKARFR